MFVALVYALDLRLKGGTSWKCSWQSRFRLSNYQDQRDLLRGY